MSIETDLHDKPIRNFGCGLSVVDDESEELCTAGGQIIKKEEAISNSSSYPQLSHDLTRLLNTQDFFCDAILKCGTAEISVHKCILSVRSPVFAAIFKSQMEEGKSGTVDIVDIESTTLSAMLKYIYSGKTDDLTASLAGDLLFAAGNYQLEELKQICIDKLKSDMTVNNVFHVLVLGDYYDQSLKADAIEFLCKGDKFSALEETEAWELFKWEYPGLSIEVLTSVVKYLRQNLSSISEKLKDPRERDRDEFEAARQSYRTDPWRHILELEYTNRRRERSGGHMAEICRQIPFCSLEPTPTQVLLTLWFKAMSSF